MENWKEKLNKLPLTSGVYLFKDKEKKVLYVGKATNLKKRVQSYFVLTKNSKNIQITKKSETIDFIETETVIEALIKEAEIIKKYRPPYNIKENDDRSFLYVLITKEEYPRVLLKRGKEIKKDEKGKVFGPFVYSSEIRSALKIIRKIFPYSTHTKKEINTKKPCFYYQINLCPGVCVGSISKEEYKKNIKNIEMFFEGKKKKIISFLKKQMEEESKAMKFEMAEELRKKINSLLYIQDVAILKKKENNFQKKKKDLFRIEGYDISNISGEFSVGSMVVFDDERPLKSEYRLFKIKNVSGPNDTEMLKEVVRRRLKNKWELPKLIVVDGGKGQVSAVKSVLKEEKIKIDVLGIAKGKDRKKEEVIGELNPLIKKETLLLVQDEAHRFAINYHRKIRGDNFLK
jgi:excinuclease ABC subunit C